MCRGIDADMDGNHNGEGDEGARRRPCIVSGRSARHLRDLGHQLGVVEDRILDRSPEVPDRIQEEPGKVGVPRRELVGTLQSTVKGAKCHSVQPSQQLGVGGLETVQRQFYAREHVPRLFPDEDVEAHLLHLGPHCEQTNVDAGIQHCAPCVPLHGPELFLQPVGPDLHLGADHVGNVARLGETVARSRQMVDVATVHPADQKHEVALAVALARRRPLLRQVVKALLEARHGASRTSYR